MMESRGKHVFFHLFCVTLHITINDYFSLNESLQIFTVSGNTYVNYGPRNEGVNEVASTLHWGESGSHNGFMKTHAHKSVFL